MRRSTLLGGKRRTNGVNIGEPIRTRKGKLAERDKHDARLVWVVQVKKGAEEICSLELSWPEKEILFNYDETKSKEVKTKTHGNKKSAYRGQSVRYRSCGSKATPKWQ